MAEEEPVWNKPARAKLGKSEANGATTYLLPSLPALESYWTICESTLTRKETFLIELWLAAEAGQENIFMSDKTVTGTKQRKEKLSSWLCQEVPRLNICFWALSENVLERGLGWGKRMWPQQCKWASLSWGPRLKGRTMVFSLLVLQLCTRTELHHQLAWVSSSHTNDWEDFLASILHDSTPHNLLILFHLLLAVLLQRTLTYKHVPQNREAQNEIVR